VTIDAISGETFFGVVESVGVLAETGGWRDPNRREYSVRIALDHDNSDGVLKPSMRAEAEIMLGAVQDALTVPVQAVFSDGPVKYVHVPRGSRFERVPVQVGRMSDTSAEILKGLGDGTRVLLREPEAGEVLAGDWTREQLEGVGVALDDQGNPITARRGAEMMRMMMEEAGGVSGVGGFQMQQGDGQMMMQRGGGPGGDPSASGGREGFQRQGGQRPEGMRQGGGQRGQRPGGERAGESSADAKPENLTETGKDEPATETAGGEKPTEQAGQTEKTETPTHRERE